MSFEFGQDDARTIGEFLKSVRLQKELAIEEAAESLKIHRRFLVAIEEDRYEDLPGPIYKDLFLKAYSDYLGIDLEETLLRLPEKDPSAQPDPDAGKEPAKSELEREIRKDISKMPTASAGGIKRTRTHMLILTVVAVVIVIVMVVILKLGGGGTSSPPSSTTPTATEETPAVAADTLQAADTTSALQRIMVRIEATDSCYAEVYADAESIEVGFVLPDEPIRCTMQDSLWVKLGRPGVARIWVDSLPVRLWPASDRGVVSRSITRQNYLGFVDSTLLLDWR